MVISFKNLNERLTPDDGQRVVKIVHSEHINNMPTGKLSIMRILEV